MIGMKIHEQDSIKLFRLMNQQIKTEIGKTDYFFEIEGVDQEILLISKLADYQNDPECDAFEVAFGFIAGPGIAVVVRDDQLIDRLLKWIADASEAGIDIDL